MKQFERVQQVKELLESKYKKLGLLKGEKTILKDMTKLEILTIEIVLKTLAIPYETRSCCQCGDPETAATDEQKNKYCLECTMKYQTREPIQ